MDNTKWDDQRLGLAPYVDRRVEVEGVFERLTTTRFGNVTVALVQDAVVKVGNTEIDLGHLWVQHAESFVNTKQFERVAFLARVGGRKRLNGNGDTEVAYNLAYPTAITPKSPPALRIPSVPVLEPMRRELPPIPQVEEVDPKPTQPATLPDPELACRSADPVQLLLDLRTLAERAGGWKNLEALVRLLQK